MCCIRVLSVAKTFPVSPVYNSMDEQLFLWVQTELVARKSSIAELVHYAIKTRLASDRDLADSVYKELPSMLALLSTLPRWMPSITPWACKVVAAHFSRYIKELADIENGWHFSATHALPSQIEGFSIAAFAATIKEIAPDLWELLYMLMSKTVPGQSRASKRSASKGTMDEDEIRMWEELAEFLGEAEAYRELSEEEKKEERERYKQKLVEIVRSFFRIACTLDHTHKKSLRRRLSLSSPFLCSPQIKSAMHFNACSVSFCIAAILLSVSSKR